jgi:hypothetical protein
VATLTLTVAANSDDYEFSDADNPNSGNPIRLGGVNTTTAGHGIGFRFDNVTLTSADTITSVRLSLMKSGSQWSQMSCRWAFENSDDAAPFSGSSPNRPGDRPIVSGSIADQSLDRNETDGTRYEFPSTTPLRTTLAAGLTAVLARGGWVSGNAVALICNSDQDASAYTTSARKNFHGYESATASSEPQLIIDYTPGSSGTAHSGSAVAAATLNATAAATVERVGASAASVSVTATTAATVRRRGAAAAAATVNATTTGTVLRLGATSAVIAATAGTSATITRHGAASASVTSEGSANATVGAGLQGSASASVGVSAATNGTVTRSAASAATITVLAATSARLAMRGSASATMMLLAQTAGILAGETQPGTASVTGSPALSVVATGSPALNVTATGAPSLTRNLTGSVA